jgi:type IV pilus assembly protein PilB
MYTKKKLGEILLDDGVLSQEELKIALSEQRGSKKRLGEILIDNGHITEKELAMSLSRQLFIEYQDISELKIDKDIISLVPETVARLNTLIPIKKEGETLVLAVYDPLDYSVVNDLEIYTGYYIKLVICEKSKIVEKIKEVYISQRAFAAADELSKHTTVIEVQKDERQESDQPIIRFVNNMIEQAVILQASDIHIEPGEKNMLIRFRIDGHLMKYMEMGMDIFASLISRIKFIGGMNIAEKRTPQDGRINFKSGIRDVDLRISVLPTVFGEKVVIRITTALGLELKRDQIGFSKGNLKKFDQLLKNPYGIVLLTGPTGSGKSTTLYTALRELRREDINIVTVEDPVEMIIPGISQVEINTRAGLTFANTLRSILRQDPDIIMVGEIRDEETADIAARVAVTGHLVFSTLHTYDAASAINRLIDMGVAPFMVASSVIGVISQRLVRKICTKCKKSYIASEHEKEVLGVKEDVVLYRGEGCEYCGFTGYKGRIAIHEILIVSPKIRNAIYRRKSLDEIKELAILEGMVPMKENARQIVMDGTTSFSEIIEVFAAITNM